MAQKPRVKPTPSQPMVSVMEGLPQPVSLSDIEDISEKASLMLEKIRDRMLQPNPRKVPPVFSLAQLGDLCRMEKGGARYFGSKHEDLPKGTIAGGNNRREFSLSEVQQWIKKSEPFGVRPAGARGKIGAIGNFKGGVTKTTTTKVLSQGLSLRGRRVLEIDLDPQASLTALNGILSSKDVTVGHTVMPFIYGEQPDLRYAIRPTYWDGVDIIPACSALFNAEFYLPTKQVKNPEFEFWSVLEKGLRPLLDEYDVILIDTPPALSYLTINAFMAADFLVVPTPPNALDFASSTEFWSLFSDLTSNMRERIPSLNNKKYDFIDVVLTKTDHTQTATNVVREWIKMTYGSLVVPTEIPATAVAQSAAAEFGTAYDSSTYSGSSKTYLRAREAYDAFCDLVDKQLMAVWHAGTGKGVE